MLIPFRPSVILSLIILVCAVLGNAQLYKRSARTSDIRTAISYCNLAVPEFWKQANADFYVMYAFEVDNNGKAVNIKKLRDEIVGDVKVRACIDDWRITRPGKGKAWAVAFRWKHGKGWVSQEISTSGFRVTMSLSPDEH